MSVIRRMVSSYFLALAAVVVLAGRSVWPQNPRPPIAAAAPLSIVSVAWSPDGKRLATESDDGAKVWDAETGKELLTVTGDSVAWNSDGTRLATATREGAKVWDAETGQELLTLSGPRGWVETLAWSPDGKRLAAAGSAVKVWDAETGQELLALSHSLTDIGLSHSVAWSPDGKRLAAGRGASVKVWEAETGKELVTVR